MSSCYCIQQATIQQLRPFVVEAAARSGAWIPPGGWGPYHWNCAGISNSPGKMVSLKCYNDNGADPYVCPDFTLKPAIAWDSYLNPRQNGEYGVGDETPDANLEITQSYCFLGSRGVIDLYPDIILGQPSYILSFRVEEMGYYAPDLFFYVPPPTFSIWIGINNTGSIQGEYLVSYGSYPKFTIVMQ